MLQNQELKLAKITAKRKTIGNGMAHKEPSNSGLKLLPSLDPNPSPHSSLICSVIVKTTPSSQHTSGISRLKNSHLLNKAMKSIAGLKKSVVNTCRAENKNRYQQ